MHVPVRREAAGARDQRPTNGHVINGHVLVLNRSWLAIHITTARHALGLLFQGHARAMHPEDFSLYDFDDWCENSRVNGHEGARYVHTPSMQIRVPDVILLNFFNGFIRHEVHFSRNSIFERDQNVCQYCAKRLPKAQLTIDHVVPQSRGGDDSWQNLVLACLKCNVKKANRTPDEARMPLIRAPQRPHWIPHLASRVPKQQMGVWRRFVDTTYWEPPTVSSEI
jgi:5-methylcytosine-specific restriction endonuclease McrA